LPEKILHHPKLIQIEGRFPTTVFRAVIMRLGMSYSGFLRFLDHLGLRLCSWRHEANQRVPHSLLHRVLRGSVEGQPIDDRSNNDPTPNEFADGVGYIGIVSPESINPANYEEVTFPENIEQPFPLGPFPEPCGDSRNAVVGQDQVGLEASLFGLDLLMLQRLVY
jgi:hypothetical protein